MRVLLIEDEPDFVHRLQGIACRCGSVELINSDEAGGRFELSRDDGGALEEQLTAYLEAIVRDKGIDLILLDTDLSQDRNLRSQTEYRYSLAEIGVPTLRYRKRADRGKAGILKFVHRLAVEGATVVRVPDAHVRDEGLENQLFPWLFEIHKGFAALQRGLNEHPDYLEKGDGPAGVLTQLLGRPELHADLLGYTAPNAYFFGTTEPSGFSSEKRRVAFATRLGYWLVNYILAFPGPILPPAAAAAALNLTMNSFKRPDIQHMILPARYTGPFGDLEGGLYWRQDLINLVMKAEGDIANNIKEGAESLDRVNPEAFGQAYYCLVTNEPIAATDAAMSPDWIPPGATMARISQDDLDELGPMLNI